MFNDLASVSLPDTQASAESRGIAIDAVGIRGLRYPITVADGPGRESQTVGTFDMRVHLPADKRGTHMSRFIELVQATPRRIDAQGIRQLTFQMVERLDAQAGELAIAFPFFHEKAAPVSGVKSLTDCEVEWHTAVDALGCYHSALTVLVPATSLCPCSKSISAYGAHNQRSHIRIQAALSGTMHIHELIQVAEAAASCPTYAILKRADEKSVTEKAYENAKFVEDMVRDVAAALRDDGRVARFLVEVENFESIHNHSAVARIASCTRPQAGC